MIDEIRTVWKCPKDGTAMQSQGRRSRAWRCPTCKGIFMDTEATRRGRPPKWSPILTSVVMSLLARAVVRHLRQLDRAVVVRLTPIDDPEPVSRNE